MPRFERCTTRRGRSAVPTTFRRTRRCRRSRACRLVSVVISNPLGALADLAADVLAFVANALALVRLGRPYAADLRSDLADLLLVRALDDDLRRRRHFEGDPLRRFLPHRVRVPDAELEGLALEV